MKSPVTSGVVYEQMGGELPANILTWHDVSPHRVWVHSRLTDDGHKPLSIEFQWIGESAEVPSIADEEIEARLFLAKVKIGQSVDTEINASTLRAFSLGQILDNHATMVTKRKLRNSDDSRTKLRVAGRFEIETFSESDLDGQPMALATTQLNRIVLRASSSDSLLIAKVYSEQTESGNKRPAKSTANLLHIETAMVYVAVRTARKNGWLSSEGTGVSGGRLTDSGHREFVSISGDKLISNYLSQFTGRRK
jgi:hypothetical protein